MPHSSSCSDELTIARSRKHIQKYYKASIAALGGFPERKKPVSPIPPEIDSRGRFLSYDKLPPTRSRATN